ncbi:MAG: ABC transporter ATP-binding protein [Alphaproteobacteria bacterium]|nr:ABC transporter ATP-binding protein [Alphaproteobacteria bacterium]
MIAVQNLSVAYGTAQALDAISLTLAQGRRLAVLGESGSGKSTLAMAICGLLPTGARTTGRIGFPTLNAPVLGRDIGVVFQDPAGSLNPVLTIGEQIAEVAVVHRGHTWREAEAHAARLLDRMGIPRPTEALRRHPHEFSGGQRQRIALAAALAADPVLLIADEPTSALDTVVQHAMVELLDSLVRERGLTLLFVTHDIALASMLADEVAILHAGRLMESGPVAQVFRTPAHAYTRALLAARLDLDTPLQHRLPEIGANFTVVTPHG